MADALPGSAGGAAAGGAPPEGPTYAHPVAAFFLFFFKATAVVFYIFCGWLPTDFVINFCVITFLLVCDFWTVCAEQCCILPAGAFLTLLAGALMACCSIVCGAR